MSEWQHLIDKHQAALDAAAGIPTWTAKDELAWLAEEASKRHDILEIGTYRGHSAKVLARATKGRVTCFDMCPDEGVEESAIRNLSIEPNVELIHCDAGVSAARMKLRRETSFDMVWIDDGHTYDDVVRDCLIALLLRHSPHSLICGHDYREDIARAVNDCFGKQNVKFGPGSIWYL